MFRGIKNKYEFTGAQKQLSNGIIVKRIRRLSDGLLGGWIESEDNLSHCGSCFIYNEAVVYNDARVADDAKIFNNVKIGGQSDIRNNAIIRHNVIVKNSFINENVDAAGNGCIVNSCVNQMVMNDSYTISNCSINKYYSNKINVKNATLMNCKYENITEKEITLEDIVLINGIFTFDPSLYDFIIIQGNSPCRATTYYKPKDGDQIKANIGCQRDITLEQFKKRIFDGIEYCSYRKEYLKQIKHITMLFGDIDDKEFAELKEKYSNKEE